MTASATPPGAATEHGYPGLDGLRALAVASVFAFHAALASEPLRAHLGRYIVHLDLGVEVFFVLSGFLIYRPFVAAHLGARPRPSLRGYARRRALRIYPAYWLALVVLWAVGGIAIDGVGSFLREATLTSSYLDGVQVVGGFDLGQGLPQAWTLVVEVSFYVFAPCWALVVAWAGRRVGARRCEAAGALGLIAVGYLATWMALHHDLPSPLAVLPPQMCTLGVGMLLAVVTVVAETSPRVERAARLAGRPAGAWWAAALAVFVVLAHRPFGFLLATPGERFEQAALQAVVASLLVAPAVLGDQRPGMVRAVLRWRVVAYVGVVSYGVYLWHVWLIDEISSPRLPGASVPVALVWLAIAFAASVGVASASWFGLERPVLRRARRPMVGSPRGSSR